MIRRALWNTFPPTPSMTMSTGGTGSSYPIASSAPCRNANSRFSGVDAMPTTWPAPSAFATWTDVEPSPPAADVPPPATPEGEEGAAARISFRLTEHLKGRIEEAAAQAGLSVNAWLVRAASAALESGDRDRRPSDRHAPLGGQRYTGWVR